MTFVDPRADAASRRRAASGSDAAAPADDGSATARALFAELADQPAEAWLEAGRRLALAQDLAGAATLLQAARARHPADSEVQLALAGVRWQLRDQAGACALLETLLARQPDHVAAVFTLARLQIELGRVQAAQTVLGELFGRSRQPPDLVLRAARMLAAGGCKQGAADLCEAALAVGSGDPLVRVYVAALQSQLGEFARARSHYLFAIAHDPQALDAGAAYGLAAIKRYVDPADPDLARFAAMLARPDLTPGARASVLFALGKARDDLGDYPQAAAQLRAANGLVDHRSWSRKHWQRMVAAKLGGTPLPPRTPAAGECIPIFVVGAPRSGTTLVAELLGRSPQVCNRGELDWLPHYAGEMARAGKADAALLERIATAYLARLQQGETAVRWFVDKQPLNFLHVDLIRALFPQARIILCRRSRRDTALSIWSQHFDSSEYRFAYDFADIAAVLNGCARLMAKAQRDPGLLEVRYEALARDPQVVVDGLAAALGLAPFDCGVPNAARSAIGTASVWQARQPVYTRAIGRWRGYAEFVPELLRFADN
jgi:thioredoxin-like negative regulator of GroEL/LPS sulfotransferase NodH